MRMRRKRIAAYAVMIAVLAACFNFTFIDNAQAAQQGRVVRVGYYENEVFSEGASEGTVKTGYAYEYYCKLSEYTGWDYKYVYGSFSNLYQKLLDGEIDMLAGLARNPEREDVIGFPELPMGSEFYSLIKKEADTDITSDPRSFAGKRIGVFDSAITDVLKTYLANERIDAEVVLYGSYDDIYSAFDSNDIDMFVAEGSGAYGRDNAEVLGIIGTSDYYLCVNKADPDLLAELNDAQSQLSVLEPNYLNSLSTKYYSFSVASLSFSELERQWLDEHDTIRVGYLNNYLPYSDTTENGETVGIVSEIVDAVFTGLGINSMYVTYKEFDSYDEMIMCVANDEIDVAFPVGGELYYAEESGIHQSNTVVSSLSELVYKSGREDTEIHSFAINKNNSMQLYYVKSIFPNAEIIYFDSIEDCLLAVINGEADATTLNGLRVNDILKNSRYRALSIRQMTQSDNRCFGVKIGNEGLLRLLNRGLNVIGEDYGQSISYKYADALYSYTFMDVLEDNAMAVGVVAVIIVLVIILLLVRDVQRTKRELSEKDDARGKLEEKNRELAEKRKELSDALEKAKRVSASRTEMVSNISNEIKLPITAILSDNVMIKQRFVDDEEIKRYSERVDQTGRMLLDLVDVIADYSQLESGKVRLEDEPYTLYELIDDVSKVIKPKADEKHLNYEIKLDPTIPKKLIGDENMIKKVLIDLLYNAVHYTEKGSVVLNLKKVETKNDIAKMYIEVSDTGNGLKKEDLYKIQQAFDRAEADSDIMIQDTGLRLNVANGLLEMMGSRLSFNSEYKKGTTLYFVLTQRINLY